MTPDTNLINAINDLSKVISEQGGARQHLYDLIIIFLADLFAGLIIVSVFEAWKADVQRIIERALLTTDLLNVPVAKVIELYRGYIDTLEKNPSAQLHIGALPSPYAFYKNEALADGAIAWSYPEGPQLFAAVDRFRVLDQQLPHTIVLTHKSQVEALVHQAINIREIRNQHFKLYATGGPKNAVRRFSAWFWLKIKNIFRYKQCR